jgi:hypothetical protein
MLASAANIEEVLDAGAAATGAVEVCNKPSGSAGGLPGGVYDSSTRNELESGY